MEHSHLSIEVCEHIIDCCYIGDPTWAPRMEYEALRACALTCSAWVFRARYILYRHIWLRTSRTPDLLERTLQATPHLGDYVRRLTVGDPRFRMISIGRVPEYISFSRGIFLRCFTNLRSLNVFNIPFLPLPPHYHHLLRKFRVTELRISFQDVCKTKGTTAEYFRLIWALPELRFCEVWSPQLPSANMQEIDTHAVTTIETGLVTGEWKNRQVCRNLDHLILHFCPGTEKVCSCICIPYLDEFGAHGLHYLEQVQISHFPAKGGIWAVCSPPRTSYRAV